MGPKLAILTHEFDRYHNLSYYMRDFVKLWTLRGFEVTLVEGIKNPPPKVHVAMMHVDLSVVPQEYLDYAKQFPVVLNGNITDITKRAYSQLLLSKDDEYEGKVVVKSNLNAGGFPEERMAKAHPELGIRQRQPSILYPADESVKEPNYLLYDAIQLVPSEVWGHPDVVVEKYLPEQVGELYCARFWLFFGDKDFQYKAFSPNPICKGNIVRRELISEPVPEELRQVRKKLGFDFGKFDYAINDGNVILFDVNRTVTYGHAKSNITSLAAQTLAPGIDFYKPRRSTTTSSVTISGIQNGALPFQFSFSGTKPL